MKKDRRKSIKANVTIPVTISVAGRETIDGVINDISASGILFSTDARLDTGQVIEFTFDRTHQPFKVEAEILRSQDSEDGCKGYGCRLINLTAAKESNIRRYIFSLKLSKPADN